MDLSSYHQPELQLWVLFRRDYLNWGGRCLGQSQHPEVDVGFEEDARRLRAGLGCPPRSLGLIGYRQHPLDEGKPQGFLAVTCVGMIW